MFEDDPQDKALSLLEKATLSQEPLRSADLRHL